MNEQPTPTASAAEENKGQSASTSDKNIVLDDGRMLYAIIVISENLAGVLNQVTNVFTRRQLNIESINVSPSGIDHVHKYTITCFSDEATVRLITKQIEKKIDVIKAQYFTPDKLYIMEQALYKIATARLLENKEISKAIRLYDAKIVEVNQTYSIVSVEGLPKSILALYEKFQEAGCLLQYASSGIIAVTKSRREKVSEYIELRDEMGRALLEDTILGE